MSSTESSDEGAPIPPPGPEQAAGARAAAARGPSGAEPQLGLAGGRETPELPGASWTPLLLLALGLALLRFLRLGDWGLWVDEAHTLHDSLVPEGLSFLDFPLGYMLTKGVVAIAGSAPDEWSLRLLPACFGALGLPLTYWAFRPFVGRRRALLAALLLGVSSWHLYWSQSARAYTLAQDLALIGGGLVTRGVLQGPPRRVLIGLGIAGLAVFAHPSAAFLLPVWVFGPALLQRLGVELPRKYSLAPLVLLAAAGLLVLGGWGASVWSNYVDAKAGSSLLHFALSTGYYVTPFLVLGALLGACVAWVRRQPVDLLALAVCATVGGLGLCAAFFVRVTAQYVFVALPWIALLATAPLDLRWVRERAWSRWALLVLLLLPAAVDSALYFGPRHGNRPRWGEAYAYVWGERGPDDLVVGMAAPVGEYYLAPGTRHLRSHRSMVRLNAYFRHIPAHWARQGRRIWYVVRREDLATWESDDRKQFIQMLETQCELEATFEVDYTPRDLDVLVYVREPSGGS